MLVSGRAGNQGRPHGLSRRRHPRVCARGFCSMFYSRFVNTSVLLNCSYASYQAPRYAGQQDEPLTARSSAALQQGPEP